MPGRERHRECRRRMADDQHRRDALSLELLADGLEEDGTEAAALRQIYHHGLQSDVEPVPARLARQVILSNVGESLVKGPAVALGAGRGRDREIEPPAVRPQAPLVLVAPHLAQKQDELQQDYLREVIFQTKICHGCGSRLRGKRVLTGF